MTKYDSWLKYSKSSRQSVKVYNKTKHLDLLNNITNGYCAKVIKSLFGNWIEKIKIDCTGAKITGKDFISYHKYGHLSCGQSKTTASHFRMSTCIDKSSNTVTIPMYEFKHFDSGNYIMFTTGDLFLIVDVKKIWKKYKTDLRKVGPIMENIGNYVIPISWLFSNNFVSHFGTATMDQFEEGTNKTVHNINKIKLPKNFENIKLDGCLDGCKEKFIVVKIANADNADYFEYKYYKSSRAIFNDIKKSNITTVQGIRKQAKTNTTNLKDMQYSIKPSIFNFNGVKCLIFDNRENLDIEKIRQYIIQ